jgi:hypothetical protein
MKRSTAIALIAAGTAVVAWYALQEDGHCGSDANDYGQAECGHGGGGHGGSLASDSDVSRGGFGEAGAAHGGGGE